MLIVKGRAAALYMRPTPSDFNQMRKVVLWKLFEEKHRSLLLQSKSFSLISLEIYPFIELRLCRTQIKTCIDGSESVLHAYCKLLGRSTRLHARGAARLLSNFRFGRFMRLDQYSLSGTPKG
jgi:hypothetical protein